LLPSIATAEIVAEAPVQTEAAPFAFTERKGLTVTVATAVFEHPAVVPVTV